ncbi:UNVERIFIED_CONTAM: hypothetical protein DQE83_29115, partial [Escherichia coli]
FFTVLPIKHGEALEIQQQYSARVVKIIDGDSFQVSHHGKHVNIRLYGIDAPEWRQPFSRSAKKYLQSILQGEVVDVQ